MKLGSWTGNRPEKVIDFYADDIFYSDPYLKDGVKGKEEFYQTIRYFEDRLVHFKVDVRLNTKVDIDMLQAGEYDHVVINRALDDSVAVARAILNAERTRRERYIGLDAFVHALTEERS